MVQKIAPNVLGPFLDPMRALLKQLLYDARFNLQGLDRKIEIDMPAMPAIGDLDFENMLDALMREQPARFVIQTADGQKRTLMGTPVKLRITAHGWRVSIHHRRLNKTLHVNVANIIKVIAAGESEDLPMNAEPDSTDSLGEISE